MKPLTSSLSILLTFSLFFVGCSSSDDDDDLTPGDGDWSLGTYQFYSLSPVVFGLTEEGTDLRLDLTQNAIWFQGDQAGLLYTEITGDFSMSATVRAQRSSDNTQAPDCNVCLGGLMARNPDDASGENYVHIVVGRNPAGVGVETKTTLNSVSTFTPYDDNLSEAELRMTRDGDSFTLYRRDVGSTRPWTAVETYERPDLPETLQVGFNIYTSVTRSTVADLSVAFEGIDLTNQ